MWQNIMIVITTFATMGMFTVSYRNFRFLQLIENERKKLEKNRDEKEQEFREQLSDLYRAIVISNLLSGNSDLDMTHKKFSKEYDGKIEIFKK